VTAGVIAFCNLRWRAQLLGQAIYETNITQLQHGEPLEGLTQSAATIEFLNRVLRDGGQVVLTETLSRLHDISTERSLTPGDLGR